MAHYAVLLGLVTLVQVLMSFVGNHTTACFAAFRRKERKQS